MSCRIFSINSMQPETSKLWCYTVLTPCSILTIKCMTRRSGSCVWKCKLQFKPPKPLNPKPLNPKPQNP